MKSCRFFLIFFQFYFFATIYGCSDAATDFALPQKSDQFSGQVFYNNKVDILFVIDNSKSMLQYQQRLSAKIQDLTATLGQLGMDYRIAVTTTTMSTDVAVYPMSRKLIGDPVYLTPNQIHLLADRIIVGESGSDLERGLDAMTWVTSSEYLSSIRSDFIRSDALLSLIFISDEIDQSSYYGNPNSLDFINLLNQRKPAYADGTRAWVANYIGILTNQSCDLLGGHVSIGTQFIQLVDFSNGVKSSICQPDLSGTVASIRARIVSQLTNYRFKDTPNKSTISVVVGGRIIVEDPQNGWTLTTETLANGQVISVLKFNGASIPAASEQVVVKYKPAGVT